MRLAASVMVRNELGRYLEPCIDHLAEFCDLVVVFDDASTDGSLEYLKRRLSTTKSLRVHWLLNEGPLFFAHEGKARQRLLDCTLSWSPTHVLAIDADEFVTDGDNVRRTLRYGLHHAYSLCMEEVWNADEDTLELRQDGGWDEHDVVAVWRVASFPRPRIADRALACGRVPTAVNASGCVDSAILHFGWTNQGERAARHDRYAVADGGRFHQKSHLDSILLPDDEIVLSERSWPDGLAGVRDRILERTRRA